MIGVGDYGLYGSGSQLGAYAYGSGTGVYASASGSTGIAVDAHASSSGATGVQGVGGYQGVAATGGIIGVQAISTNNSGAGAVATGYVGVQGQANGSSNSQGVRGEDGSGGSSTTTFAGVFNGRVIVTGSLSKPAGSFQIDHPLDPTNKYLYHSFVESPDMKNVYDGVVTLGADGTAVVTLPDYFEALNRDFRYQLTCIGGHANVYVSHEVADNEFTIDGGSAGLKVSWQVTGIRQDAYAKKFPIPVEVDKTGADKGRYLHPAAFGKQASQGVALVTSTVTPRAVPAHTAPKPPAQGFPKPH